ncbi:MAG: DUF4266 domain-containing protein [Chitinophagales bacterium]|nr:DUF4266 domain-containing protein [Chitinophagales bacterium]
MKNIKWLVAVFSICYLSSCTTVMEYEKVYLNDPDMELADKSANRFENNFQSYREAASGANGGKTGGGCGCN